MDNKKLNFEKYLNYIGLHPSANIIVHSGFNRIQSVFPEITPNKVIDIIKKIITPSGSIVYPAFTYCFKKSFGGYEKFDREDSKSKVGLLSETFRLSKGGIRTSSPTHSFVLWGKITIDIDEYNSPESSLGKGSVLEWLTNHSNSFVLILGTDFSSLTYGHYLEIAAKVPWFDFSPWDYMNVLPIGVSIAREQKLKEIPGCAKSFINFEKYLTENKIIDKLIYKSLESYLIPIELLYKEGTKYFKNNYETLLCPKGTCPACDSRRTRFLR